MDVASMKYRRKSGDMIATYKYTLSMYSVNSNLLVVDGDTVTKWPK